MPAANYTMETTAAKVGISMKEVTDKLTDDGVRLFAGGIFDKLLAAVREKFKVIDDMPVAAAILPGADSPELQKRFNMGIAQMKSRPALPL